MYALAKSHRMMSDSGSNGLVETVDGLSQVGRGPPVPGEAAADVELVGLQVLRRLPDQLLRLSAGERRPHVPEHLLGDQLLQRQPLREFARESVAPEAA